MINFSRGSATITMLLLATTAYGQCEYNIQTITVHGCLCSSCWLLAPQLKKISDTDTDTWLCTAILMYQIQIGYVWLRA